MTQEIVSQLKENGQDFEWYPTTVEMIEAVPMLTAGGDEEAVA